MLSSKTVFIIGAGASKEVGLPVGGELGALLAEKLDIRFDQFRGTHTGSDDIVCAMRASVRDTEENDIRPLVRSAWAIRDAARLFASIDNFLDARAGDKSIELCGKLAIAEVILEAERGSALCFDQLKSKTFNHESLSTTWYPALFRLLAEGINHSHLGAFLENAYFIVFNYDRCIEHYLSTALQTYYGCSEEDAFRVISGHVLHPYGTVGQWKGAYEHTPFGEDPDGHRLLTISSQVRTFTEGIADSSDLERTRQWVKNAETLVFLGFAFHKLNLELLNPQNPAGVKRIFSTGFGISEYDREALHNRLVANLQLNAHTRVQLVTGMTCTQLFSDFSYTLRN